MKPSLILNILLVQMLANTIALRMLRTRPMTSGMTLFNKFTTSHSFSTQRRAVTSDVEVEDTVVPEEDLFSIDLPTNENSLNLLKIRHTSAHVMAMAVQKLDPNAQVTIGPWIESGFYYDFFFPEKQLSDADLKLIKKEMDKIIKANLPIRREEVSREEARSRILAQNEPFKLEVLDSIKTEPITIYHIGDQVI
jgi:threonyl-tRNA synthetase